jgi:hypothetical protein
MPIAVMLRYAELVRSGHGEADRLALLHAHRARITDRIAELTGDLDLIDQKISIYQDQLSLCEAGPKEGHR